MTPEENFSVRASRSSWGLVDDWLVVGNAATAFYMYYSAHTIHSSFVKNLQADVHFQHFIVNWTLDTSPLWKSPYPIHIALAT